MITKRNGRPYKAVCEVPVIASPNWSRLVEHIQPHYSLARISVDMGFGRDYLSSMKRKGFSPMYEVGVTLLTIHQRVATPEQQITVYQK